MFSQAKKEELSSDTIPFETPSIKLDLLQKILNYKQTVKIHWKRGLSSMKITQETPEKFVGIDPT